MAMMLGVDHDDLLATRGPACDDSNKRTCYRWSADRSSRQPGRSASRADATASGSLLLPARPRGPSPGVGLGAPGPTAEHELPVLVDQVQAAGWQCAGRLVAGRGRVVVRGRAGPLPRQTPRRRHLNRERRRDCQQRRQGQQGQPRIRQLHRPRPAIRDLRRTSGRADRWRTFRISAAMSSFRQASTPCSRFAPVLPHGRFPVPTPRSKQDQLKIAYAACIRTARRKSGGTPRRECRPIWPSGRQDLNLRPLDPQAGLRSCATCGNSEPTGPRWCRSGSLDAVDRSSAHIRAPDLLHPFRSMSGLYTALRTHAEP
jgi:hypothetical protein